MTTPRTAHFRLWEFSCPEGGRVPERYRANLQRLMDASETGRYELGDLVWIVISGWRSPAYNRKNKGRATNSRHLTAEAIDFRVRAADDTPRRLTHTIGGRRYLKPAVVYWVLHDMMMDGLIPKGGLAAYSTFTHYDIRGWAARWRKAPERP